MPYQVGQHGIKKDSSLQKRASEHKREIQAHDPFPHGERNCNDLYAPSFLYAKTAEFGHEFQGAAPLRTKDQDNAMPIGSGWEMPTALLAGWGQIHSRFDLSGHLALGTTKSTLPSRDFAWQRRQFFRPDLHLPLKPTDIRTEISASMMATSRAFSVSLFPLHKITESFRRGGCEARSFWRRYGLKKHPAISL
jgi:hypothetical protein